MEDSVRSLRTLWAIDCSGSVNGFALYHDALKKIVSQYYKEGDDIWLWDNDMKHITYEDLQMFIEKRNGYGGTESSLIADIAQNSPIHEHLLIVTDGCVNGASIDRADLKMKSSGILFQYVTTFVIGSGGDLSVSAPYQRGCPNKTFVIRNNDEMKPVSFLSSDDLNALQSIHNISDYNKFVDCYDNLLNAITAMTLGTTGNPDIKGELSSLNERVINSEINDVQKEDFNKKLNILIKMSDGILRNTFTTDSIEVTKKAYQ